MTSDEIDYTGAANGVVTVMHEKGIPISKVSRDTSDASTDTESSAEPEISDEEAHKKALEMMDA